MELTEHPIMLTLQDTISGDGFLAGVTLFGRALMRKEDDGKWWMYGVRPSAIAESGNTINETFLRFRNRYKEVLFDIAQDNKRFEDFKAEVERFFNEPDEEDEHLWNNALKAIRSSKISPPAPFDQLPRESPESKPSKITIERLDVQGKRFKSSDNATDIYALPNAA